MNVKAVNLKSFYIFSCNNYLIIKLVSAVDNVFQFVDCLFFFIFFKSPIPFLLISIKKRAIMKHLFVHVLHWCRYITFSFVTNRNEATSHVHFVVFILSNVVVVRDNDNCVHVLAIILILRLLITLKFQTF